MAEVPNCCDNETDLVRKILLQILSSATNPPENLFPIPSDSTYEMSRKILLTLAFL